MSGLRRTNVKTSNEFTKWFARVTERTADRVSLSRLRSPIKSSSVPTSVLNSKSSSLGTSSDGRSLPLSSTGTAKSIEFGSPSSNRLTGSQGTGEWTNLLKQTASGGLSSALGGGALSGVGGVGALVSAFAELFHSGVKVEAPLTLFRLPDSQSETILAAPNQTRTAQEGTRSGGIYTAPSNSSAQIGHGQLSSAQNAQITEAVKQALLNSSSLNDVIAEI